MCQTCKKVKVMDQQSALIEIGVAMEEAESEKQIEHLSDLLDRILGTEQIEQDVEADEAWERSHR